MRSTRARVNIAAGIPTNSTKKGACGICRGEQVMISCVLTDLVLAVLSPDLVRHCRTKRVRARQLHTVTYDCVSRSRPHVTHQKVYQFFRQGPVFVVVLLLLHSSRDPVF